MTETTSAQRLVSELTDLLRVEPLGNDAFEGARAPEGGGNDTGRVYGGQLIAQAFAAAEATVPDGRPPHSLHAYFLRMGDFRQPIRYEVDRDLDGGSFANRRIVARQGDRLLLSMNASFHRIEESVEHQDEMPQVPPPEALRPRLVHAIEQRSVENAELVAPTPGPPHMHVWMRAAAALPDDPRVHRALLLHASDAPMLPTAWRPHGLNWSDGNFQGASLDHAVWFHDDFRMDDWLLYETHSSWAGRARGHISGKIYRRDGQLVASVVQEGMIRRIG